MFYEVKNAPSADFGNLYTNHEFKKRVTANLLTREEMCSARLFYAPHTSQNRIF